MKVLVVNPILYTSETDHIPKVESIKDTMIYTLCMGFVKNGDMPTLVAADCYKPISDEKYSFEIQWFACGAPKICKPRCIPYLKGFGNFLRRRAHEFDYIISSEVFSLATLQSTLWARRKTIIWHELGAHNRMLGRIPSKIWYNVVGRCLFRGVPIVPRSERASAFIANYCTHVLPEVIDHGIDLHKIPGSSNKKDYFVILSQLIERKRIDQIIEKFHRFAVGEYSQYQLLVIGDGECKDSLQGQVSDLGREGEIHFLGKLDHTRLMPILASAKAMLVNTEKDNSMVSIVESIAAGTPVITTSIPFNAPYIRENELGIVDDQWDKDDLQDICENNEKYVRNCLRYRDKLDHTYLARKFNEIGRTVAK